MSTPRPRPAEAPTARCAIDGCSAEAVRSLARVEVRKAFPLLAEAGRRAALCRELYKEYKKATRKDRELERLGW